MQSWLRSFRSLSLLLCVQGVLLLGCQYGMKEARVDVRRDDASARERALDYLIDYLTKMTSTGREVEQRKEAIRLAAQTTLPRAVGALRMVLMHESDALLRLDAVRGLRDLRSAAALTELRKALQDRDVDVRMMAAAALGKLGDQRALRSLLDALNDPSSSVRVAAVKALSELGAARAIPKLILALDDQNDDVRLAAQNSLLGFGEAAIQALLPYLSQAASPLQKRITELFPRFGQLAFAPLIQAFRQENSRRAAQDALAGLSRDAQSWPLIVALTKVQEKKEGEALLSQLSAVGTLSAVQALFLMWEDLPVVIKPLLRVSLGKIAARSTDEGRLLLSRFTTEGDDIARHSTAVIALGQTGAEALPLLEPHLKSPRRVIVLSAIRALGAIKQPALPRLLAYLNIEDEETRYVAIQEIGSIPDPSAVQALIKQLKHPSAKIRIASLEALGQQKDRSAVPHARDLLTDPVNDVVLASTQTLILLGDQQNINVYIAALRYGPYPPEPTYVETLGKLGDNKTLPLLRQLTRRYLQDWKAYRKQATKLLRQKRRRAKGQSREALEEAVAIDLKEHPARNPTAICSFIEALRGLQRHNTPLPPFLAKIGYQHNAPMNPLAKPPERCPWPLAAP